MAHKFDPKKSHKLDSPERRAMLPPEHTLEILGVLPGMTLVDLGCGSGYFAVPAARLVGAAGLVYAVDVHEELVTACAERLAAEGLENFRAVLAQESVIPLPDRVADAVLLVNVLHEFEDLGRSLAEIGRLLRPDGRFLVVEWKKQDTGMGPPLAARFAPGEAEALLRASGFAVLEVVEPGEGHYGLIARLA